MYKTETILDGLFLSMRFLSAIDSRCRPPPPVGEDAVLEQNLAIIQTWREAILLTVQIIK